ncbi:MAG: hypothetical protein K2J80_10610 [Oscillospiraceae bacterium]|nr:hypothetical protein [Oscillospiraceae bacterium]
MAKKKINSKFLNYLIENEKKFDKYGDWMENLDISDEKKLTELSIDLNERLILLYACYGEVGWCLPEHLTKHIVSGRIITDLENDVSIDEIDTKISECFGERDIESLVILIGQQLSKSEKSKLDLAFKLYLKEEYFASAVLLAGLIDSASINHYLKSIVNPENVSQCWNCYGKVIQDNFSGTYFSAEFPYKKSIPKEKRGEATIKFFKSINHDTCFDDKKDILIPLSFALLKFFEDSDWRDKQNGIIPSSINRHWLAHGMYDYDDITRADCIKLFCMLYQIVELYSML